MIVQRVGKACAEIAQVGKRLFRIVAQHIRVADEECGVVLQFADLRLRSLQRGNCRRILRVKIVRVANGEPGQRAGFGTGMRVRVGFHSGIGGGRAELDQLPRHGPQIIGSHKTAVHLVGAGRRHLLARVLRVRGRFLGRAG